MVMVHIKLETLVDDLQKRGFSHDVAERALTALTAPNAQESETN